MKPQNNSPPTVDGDFHVGGTVTGHNGSWFADPPIDTYAWEWQLKRPDGGWSFLAGGERLQTFTLPSAAAGRKIRLYLQAWTTDVDARGQNPRRVYGEAWSGEYAVAAVAPSSSALEHNLDRFVAGRQGKPHAPADELAAAVLAGIRGQRL